jgi:hypothetical protein
LCYQRRMVEKTKRLDNFADTVTPDMSNIQRPLRHEPCPIDSAPSSPTLTQSAKQTGQVLLHRFQCKARAVEDVHLPNWLQFDKQFVLNQCLSILLAISTELPYIDYSRRMYYVRPSTLKAYNLPLNWPIKQYPPFSAVRTRTMHI